MPGATFRIRRLRVEGFKAFAASQSFEIGNHLFIFGKNGLGKSSFVEAIRWCLFGLADRPEAEVRNVFYPAGECRVELDLDGPGGVWKMLRRLHPGSGRSRLVILDPNGTAVPQSTVFPHIARLGPHEGTHIIFASQQSTRRRPQADITDFDRVLYSYLQIEDVPELITHLDRELEEQAETEKQLAEDLSEVEEDLRSQLKLLRSRINEILVDSPWPGETVPTHTDTDARLREFIQECDGSLERADGGTVTRDWLLAEAERAIEQLSTVSQKQVQLDLDVTDKALQQLLAAKEEFETASGRLATTEDQVTVATSEVKAALEGTSKEQLLAERDELVRQSGQLELRHALVQGAASYFERFSPTECPVCDATVAPNKVSVRLRECIGSDDPAIGDGVGLEQVQARLAAISAAEGSLATAKGNLVGLKSKVLEARTELDRLHNTPDDLFSGEGKDQQLAARARQLKLELTKAGSLVALKRTMLKNLRAEARFQEYRAREERLLQSLDSGLEPAREVHSEFLEVLENLQSIRNALQESFNDTLNRTLPQINALMTEVYARLTQQASFPNIVVESRSAAVTRTVRVRVTSDRTREELFDPAEVLNGQAYNALNLVPYFVFSPFQAEVLELDCLLVDDPSRSFDTSRVELLMQELAKAATHAQLIVASHEEDRFAPFIEKHFPAESYRVLRVTSFTPDGGPTIE